MAPVFEIDLLKTFIAIAESGSFTLAAGQVGRTQSAISMQVKRLEDMLGRPVFLRDGRRNRLTGDGERLLLFARRILEAHDDAICAMVGPALDGIIRFGTPDDYADMLLPDLLRRFGRTHPLVQVDVECLPSVRLLERIRQGELDLAMVSCGTDPGEAEVIRQEPLVWVAARDHEAWRKDPLPLAVENMHCSWREMTLAALAKANRRYRIAFGSMNATAIDAAVMAGIAVAAMPLIAVKPAMKVLGESEGFFPPGSFSIGLVRARSRPSAAIDALASHIRDFFGRIAAAPIAAE